MNSRYDDFTVCHDRSQTRFQTVHEVPHDEVHLSMSVLLTVPGRASLSAGPGVVLEMLVLCHDGACYFPSFG